jgi:hypothetical protein
MNHAQLIFNNDHPHHGKRFRFQQWNCIADFSVGYSNGGTAIQLFDTDDHAPVATATVWVPGLAPDEVAIKDYSENEGMLETLLEAHIVKLPHRYVLSGYVDIPVCHLCEEPQP